MGIIKIKHQNRLKQYRLRSIVFLFFLGICFNHFAQSPDSITPSEVTEETAVTDTTGPSLTNLTKTIAAGEEERKKLEEEAKWREIMDIIYMVIGFIIVIVVAWYLATWARKQELKREEERAKRVEKALQNKPPGGSRSKRR